MRSFKTYQPVVRLIRVTHASRGCSWGVFSKMPDHDRLGEPAMCSMVEPPLLTRQSSWLGLAHDCTKIMVTETIMRASGQQSCH